MISAPQLAPAATKQVPLASARRDQYAAAKQRAVRLTCWRPSTAAIGFAVPLLVVLAFVASLVPPTTNNNNKNRARDPQTPMEASAAPETWRQKLGAVLPSWIPGAQEKQMQQQQGEPPEAADDVRSANAFAVALFGQVADTATDVFLAPVSVAAALGMLLAGTSPGGLVEDELKALLRTTDDTGAAAAALLPSQVAAGGGGGHETNVNMLMANSLWVKSAINADFKSQVSKVFDASVLPLPSDPDPVNKWVNDATRGMIPTLLDRIPPRTIAILLNAVFFKGAWTHPFDPAQTMDDILFRQPGATTEEKRVKMMVMRNQRFWYGEAPLAGGRLKMVELPYGDAKQYTALVLLPEGGATLADAVARVADWSSWMKHLSPEPVKVDYLGLPRFKLEYGASSLKPALTALGLKSPWTADLSAPLFTRMTDDPDVAIDDVLHKAAVEVTEEGTKASAATAIIMTPKSIQQPKDMRRIYVDAPFLFAIRNRESGLIVFIGRVDDPK
jgi:serine protease inhibitor